MKSKTLTVMFADIQGYTNRSAQQTREENELFITEIKVLIQACVKKRNGNLIKCLGDGFLVTFESPTDAVICGIETQKEIEKRNAFVADSRKKVNLRVGINTGEVNIDADGDVYGNTVNIASKIQESTQPGRVFVSEATYLAMNESEIKSLNLETIKTKGILKKVKLYRILRDTEEDKIKTTALKQRKFIPSNNLRFLLFLISIILLIILISDKSGRFAFINKIFGKKETALSCKIDGIIHSGKNPSVMIGGNVYFIGNLACGAKIEEIHQDKIIVDVKKRRITYRIGEIIKK